MNLRTNATEPTRSPTCLHVIDKLDHIIVSGIRLHNLSGDRHWFYPTIIWSRPRRPLAIFQLYHAIFIFRWDDGDVCFVEDQHSSLYFHSASSLKTIFMSLHSDPLFWFWANHSFSLILHPFRSGSKHWFYCLWFDLTRVQNHNLPHSRHAC